MRKSILYLLAIVVLSFVFYKLTIKHIPDVIYSRVKTKMMTQSDIKENELRILPFPTSKSRAVVKPNPDFAYVSTFYDLSDGSLHLTGPMPDSTYWSVALYEPNTNNFYVKNDLQFGTDELDIVIIDKSILKEQVDMPDDSEIIMSPRSKGFLLIRILGTERSAEQRKEIIELMNQLKSRQLI